MSLTVIIPVFNAFDHVESCLNSISSVSPGIKVLLINDASTDDRIQLQLESWVAQEKDRSLLVNERNRGFVSSVNRGMSVAKDDVVLLNSDTRVTPGWHQALTACLASDSNIATATPWSNNGEIVSFPDFCKASAIPENPQEIANVIRSAGPPVYPELPTAMGFCMAISRRAIEQLGLFDEQAFGRGYGEENDFSMRASEAGMRNVLCDDAYVAHHGGGSFTPLGLKPDSESMARLLHKHPGYLSLVEDFIKRDPLSARRKTLAEAVQRSQARMR